MLVAITATIPVVLIGAGLGCLWVARRKRQPVRRPAPRPPIYVTAETPLTSALQELLPGQVVREGQARSVLIQAPVHLYPTPSMDVARAVVDLIWDFRAAQLEVVLVGPFPITEAQADGVEGYLEWLDALRTTLAQMDHFVDRWLLVGNTDPGAPGMVGIWAEGMTEPQAAGVVAGAVMELLRG